MKKHICEKCFKEIEPEEEVQVVDFPLLSDPTKPVKPLVIHLHAKCLLELTKSGELYNFIDRVKETKLK
ncbi:hypothetical protein DRN75_02170 [Nanoarchaeota archaeon]|nr:MAG: hypothetical protein DRN75_02170 [Nanoarchaeota archaeon]